MADLSTTYLGIPLKNPVVVASSPLSKSIEQIEQMERAGAGAVVLPSLFAEQIMLESSNMDYYLDRNRGVLPETLKHVPDMKGYNTGLDGYTRLIYGAKTSVDIPIIASINGPSQGGWVNYVPYLVDAGADALELNLYYLPTHLARSGQDVEDQYLKLVSQVRSIVDIPLAIKLSPYFTALANLSQRMADAGADGLVLFNRFYQPDFDIETRKIHSNLVLSDPRELRLRLRWAALLYDRVPLELALTGGVHTAVDVLKVVFAGGRVAQLTSVLMQSGIKELVTIVAELDNWLKTHQVQRLADLEGQLSQKHVAVPDALERANYMEVIRSALD